MQQARSRFAVSAGGSGSVVSADELEAVIRELTRGHELTAQLRAEALRGQLAAEDTAAFILQEVSRAFTVCLSIMSSPAARAPPPEVPEPGGGRRREDNVPRREITTYTPNSDGYLWRKYGQKRITNTRFPRCYFRCSYHRERGCPATKQVQQHSNGDPPQYVVIYVNGHTCDTAAWEPEPEPAAAVQQQLGVRGIQEERERQALVLSLAYVLGAQSPASGGGGAFGQELSPQQLHGASVPSSVVDPNAAGGGDELPWLDVDAAAARDFMDCDVTGDLYFQESFGLPADVSFRF